MSPELRELLEEIAYQLADMWRVADDSVADYTLQIETAVNFVNKALKTGDRLDAFRALSKAEEALAVEYDETPEDEEYDDLVDRIRAVLGESMKAREIVEDETQVPPAPGGEETSARGFLKAMGRIDQEYAFTGALGLTGTGGKYAWKVTAKLEPVRGEGALSTAYSKEKIGEALRLRMWFWQNPRPDGSWAIVEPYQQFYRADAVAEVKATLDKLFNVEFPAIDSKTAYGNPNPASNNVVDALRLSVRVLAPFKAFKKNKTVRRPRPEL